ncbi:MAG: hypothetical protein VKJ24_20490, partial [Synechococcales bacterium]|nr:hypothetical protein [Synechococcales bacterium]
PEGLSDASPNYNRVRNLSHGALLVSVGGTQWEHGGAMKSFFAEQSGTVYFLVNDRDTSNNQGGFVAEVTIDPITSFMAGGR